MPNLQSFWGQIDLNSASQINSISEGFMDFLRVAKTEWEVRDFLIRRLFHFRFSELVNIKVPTPGAGFIEELDEGCVAAGVFGSSNIQKRGLNIIGCPIDTETLEIGTRSPATAGESDISTIRFSPSGGTPQDEWTSSMVSIHGIRTLKDRTTRSFVLGETRKEPGYYLLSAGEKKAQKGKKQQKQYDLVVGTSDVRAEKEGKASYPKAFMNSIGMDETEMKSSTLTLVGAEGPIEIGSDRSLIQGFGAFDRMNVFAALKMLTDLTRPEDTIAVIFYSSKGECSKKNHNREITGKLAASIAKKINGGDQETDPKEILEFSRVLDMARLKAKQTKAAEETQPKPIPPGKGTVIGTYSKGTRSARLLAIIEDNLEKKAIPFIKIPKGYEFASEGTIGNEFSKEVPEIISFSQVGLGGRGIYSTVSKIDLWAAFRAILAYSTH